LTAEGFFNTILPFPLGNFDSRRRVKGKYATNTINTAKAAQKEKLSGDDF